MNQVDAYFYAMGNAIAREERALCSKQERKENILTLWEIRSKTQGANPRIKERGDGVAANLRGAPIDCLRGMSLLEDLEWLLSKL